MSPKVCRYACVFDQFPQGGARWQTTVVAPNSIAANGAVCSHRNTGLHEAALHSPPSVVICSMLETVIITLFNLPNTVGSILAHCTSECHCLMLGIARRASWLSLNHRRFYSTRPFAIERSGGVAPDDMANADPAASNNGYACIDDCWCLGAPCGSIGHLRFGVVSAADCAAACAPRDRSCSVCVLVSILQTYKHHIN